MKESVFPNITIFFVLLCDNLTVKFCAMYLLFRTDCTYCSIRILNFVLMIEFALFFLYLLLKLRIFISAVKNPRCYFEDKSIYIFSKILKFSKKYFLLETYWYIHMHMQTHIIKFTSPALKK